MVRISVITCSLNQGQFLAQALASVQGQELEGVEHLVVDGGSVDQTGEILARHADRIRRLDRASETLAAAFNWGLRHATGDVMGWLNADDVYCGGVLARVRAEFECHPEVDVIYGAYRLVDERGVTTRRRLPRRWSARRLDRNSHLLAPAVFFRRRVVAQWGELDEGLKYCEDYEYWLRLGGGGAVFRRMWAVLGERRVRPDGRRLGNFSTRRRQDVAAESCRIAQRHLGTVPVRMLWEAGQADAEARGVPPRDSVQWDREVVRATLAADAHYNGDRGGKRVFRLRCIARHVHKECAHLLRRPRQAVRFLPAAARHFVRQHLTRKIFTLEYLPPQPVQLPASYHKCAPLPDPPRISVVTPNLNQGQYIEATLRSVLDQEYPNLEFIVQDGNSTDDSVEIIRRYASRLTHWESAEDDGQSDAINRGMQRTTGEIMAYLNSDDVLLPGSLAYVARFFQEHPDVDVVYSHRLVINEQGAQVGRWVLPPHDDRTITWADYIPQETMFWRRRAWDRAGGCMDASFSFAMDWDLILRFRAAGLRFVRLPRFLGAFRVTQEQKTSQLIATVGAREMARLRYRVHGRHATNRRIRRAVRSYIWRHWVYDTLYSVGLARY